MILYLFCLCITPLITVFTSFGGYSIDWQCKSVDWFLCDLDALIEVCSSYLMYVLFILFIYLFVLCYLCFCLLILLILLFVVVDVAYSFFNSFHCSCSGSSNYFTFLSVVRTLLFMLPLFIRTLLESAIITLYLFLFLFSLLTHCVSYSSYFHRYLYDLALVNSIIL